MKKVHVLEHDPKESAGTLSDFMSSEGIEFERVLLYRGRRLPAVSEVSALIVMGGPMNVYEEAAHPFLRPENTLIQQAVAERVPYLGICLGAQLLAKAMGARVYKAAQPEVGWLPVRLTAAARSQGGLFEGMPSDDLRVLQWHEDTFDLPSGAVQLASSPAVPHQAYSKDGIFHGLQFHLEVDAAILRSWFASHPLEQDILQGYEDYRERLLPLAGRVYKNFFSRVRGAGVLR